MSPKETQNRSSLYVCVDMSCLCVPFFAVQNVKRFETQNRSSLYVCVDVSCLCVPFLRSKMSNVSKHVFSDKGIQFAVANQFFNANMQNLQRFHGHPWNIRKTVDVISTTRQTVIVVLSRLLELNRQSNFASTLVIELYDSDSLESS